MISSGVPKEFWGKAIETTIYFVNRSLNSAIGFKVPEKVWSGKPPSIDNLRIFVCVAYAQQREGKLDPRADKCVFLGYRDRVKGYRLWSRGSKGIKIIISRDVIFSENIFPCLEKNYPHCRPRRKHKHSFH